MEGHAGSGGWGGGRVLPAPFPGCLARQRRDVFQPYSHMCFPSVVAGFWGGVCLPRPVTQPSDSCGIAEPSPFSGPRPPRPPSPGGSSMRIKVSFSPCLPVSLATSEAAVLAAAAAAAAEELIRDQVPARPSSPAVHVGLCVGIMEILVTPL